MTDPVLSEPRSRRLARQLARHAAWIRRRGARQWAAEAQLNLGERLATGLAKWRWRLRHAGDSTPVWMVGVQRSGTTMLARRLGVLPAVELHNETSRRAFRRFQLLPDAALRSLVARSGHSVVVFKALCDSHRTRDLLEHFGSASPGKAIWVYRSYEDRARSSLAKFGADDLAVLRRVSAGQEGDQWHTRGLSEASMNLIRSLDWATTSPATACAVFWYVRNMLFFELRLDERDDVVLVSYDQLLAQPEAMMRVLCNFLGLEYASRVAEQFRPRRDTLLPPMDVDSRIRTQCDELTRALDAAAERSLARVGGSTPEARPALGDVPASAGNNESH